MVRIAVIFALLGSCSSERPRPESGVETAPATGTAAPPAHGAREPMQAPPPSAQSAPPRAQPQPRAWPGPQYAPTCGVELWDVKTATDPFARYISLSPRDTTIPQLVALPHPHREAGSRINGV